MTHQAPQRSGSAPADAGQRVAQLRHALTLVRQIAGGEEGGETGEAVLEANARFSSAYANASPIVRRRFDTLADEASQWTATAVDALLAADRKGQPARAAARQLADELAAVLKRLTSILGL